MRFKWIDDLGDWNPQLLRELKGHLKPRNLLIAGVISLLGQFLFFMGFRSQLPLATVPASEGASVLYNKYCIGDRLEYGLPKCLTDSLGNPVIHWQLWWLDLFTWLSLIGILALLVAGTYLLISDLAHEERRDTLNFIRLSPQSPQSILVGKLLGVPILLYMVAGLAVPLHLWAGIAAQVPLSLILSFYAVVLASCLFCYSAALLFSLVSSWLGGFQAWLASGTVLMFLWTACFKPIMHIPGDWLNLFSPSLLLPYLIAATGIKDYGFPLSDLEIDKLEWFYLPLGANTVVVVGFALLNYGLWTYWSWQALTRRFPNPSKTIFSKQQSYLLVACFEVLTIGFAATTPKWPTSTELSVNFQFLLVYNLLLFLGLIVTLTPQRQALQDWARYRRERVSSHKSFWSRSLVQDLVWGEKSPALISIALNLAIAAAMLVPWIMFVLQDIDKLPAFFSLVIGLNLILICGAIAQMILFMRTQKQVLWVIGTVSAVILLPPVMLSLLSLYPHKTPALWLFTPFAWASIEQVSATTVFLALLGQWSILTLCTLQITRQLRQSGESASKALFAARPSLPSS
jgi:hypothetical protein